jgi:hypothetical protein
VVSHGRLGVHQPLKHVLVHDPDGALRTGSPRRCVICAAEHRGLVDDARADGERQPDGLAPGTTVDGGQSAAGENDQVPGWITVPRQHGARLDLLLAGPWADDSGALLIFSADAARVTQILQEDPYYTTPGVTVIGVRAWTPIAGQRAQWAS